VEENSLTTLIDACRNGEAAAWQELLERLSPLIFSICRDSRLSQEESLDIFGQVCYLLVKNIGQVRSADRIFSYVGTITRRQIYDRYYKDRNLEFVEPEELSARVGDVEAGPDQLFEEDRQRQLLLEALSSLPKRDYQLLMALFFDENEPSYEDIARRLKMPVSSIGPTRGRALKKLQRVLKRMGYKFDVF